MRILRLLVWGVLAVGVLCVPCMAQDAETPAAEPPPAADPAEAAAAEVRDEAAAATALPGWLAAVRVRKPEGNLEFPVRWFPDDGVSLLVRSRDTRATWTLLTLDREGLAVRLGDSANAEGRELTAVRIWDADVAREPHGEIAVTLKFREHEWIVYLGGQLFASVAAPFSPPAEVFVAETQAQLLRGAMRFRPVPQEMYRSDFMIEEGAPDQLYPWKIQSGSWRIHTAQEDALERPESDLSRVKQVPLTADKSPNFYSLKGGGKDALLTTGYDFYDDYVYAAALQLNEGEAGLAFYHRGDGSYYAYTLCIQSPPAEGGVVRLWRFRDGARTVLAQARVPLWTDQWYRPQVRTHIDEIVCLLDGVEVMRVRERLPLGGKIGLYTSTSEELRFDDVTLTAWRRVPLDTVARIRYQALHQEGTFYRDRSLLHRETPEETKVLRPEVDDGAQWLAVGRPHAEGICFSATFEPQDTAYGVGLIAGFVNPASPWYRFEVHRGPGAETYRLLRVRQGGDQLLQTWACSPPPPSPAGGRVTLTVDGTEPGRLRFLRNGALVLLHGTDGPLEGAAGPWLGAGTVCAVHDLELAYARERYLEELQHNTVFKKDSFMRHWSSPEGQWVAGEDKALWHKGDFFGDFRIELPCVPGSELHVCVPEDSTRGVLFGRVTEDSLQLLAPGVVTDEPVVLAESPLSPAEGKKVSTLQWTFNREGYWVWIDVDGTTVITHRVDRRFPGTRCRVQGLTVAHMARSGVVRDNVIADFFEETPHRWLINGGTWQIINRFQCTPSWSHMIGESKDGLAALWYKQKFQGDFTLEFYAGTRHGWYDRAGDLNCSVMASAPSPSRGYTVTCTEWDQNLSQNWTTLRRNGEILDRSDAYLVPRVRKGSVRKYLNPLVSKGRPVHGAWYYIKLRKLGNRLEYYFDNEQVFAEEDPDVLQEGLVGLWTFMHSMTVAQVKMTFEHTEPVPFPVEPLPVSDEPLLPAALTTKDPYAGIQVGGTPINSLSPAYWQVSDPVGHSTLNPLRFNADALEIENPLGAGNMFLDCELPVRPLHTTAGWSCLIRRTPSALLQAYFTLGTVDEKDTYTPAKECFAHISGCDFGDGVWELCGRPDVPGTRPDEAPVAGWAPVTIWIPSHLRTPDDEANRRAVRFEGFGLRQPSGDMVGLTGNPPGERYAVRQFTPITYGLPGLTAEGLPEDTRYLVKTALGEDPLYRGTYLDRAMEAMATQSVPGLNRFWFQCRDANGQGFSRQLAWIVLPAEVRTAFAWHPDRPDAVLLRNRSPFPDPRFAVASVGLTEPLELRPHWDETRTAVLPREALGELSAQERVTFSVDGGSGASERVLAWADRPAPPRPVLQALGGLETLFRPFESDAVPGLQMTADGRLTIEGGDDRQGRYLQVRNTAASQRLTTTFSNVPGISRHPLLQFRYRAFDMTHLSATFGKAHHVRLGDDLASAVKVRFGEDLILDGEWHTWTGFAADAFAASTFSTKRFLPATLRLASAGSPDQTGRYSRWHLDDLVCGPAVRGADQLTATPTYYVPGGIETVHMAVSSGPTPHAELDAAGRAGLSWTAFEPGQAIAPVLDGLEDGVHHLLLKAAAAAGIESSVTDVPFLLDTQPLAVTHAFGAYAEPASNGVQLTVNLANKGGAPWAIEKASFMVNGTKQAIPAWTSQFKHTTARDELLLNYPFIMRKHLDAANDGDTLEFAIDGIEDGAGNVSEKTTIPVKVDHASDKTGPSWYYFRFPASVNWFWNWDGTRYTSTVFSAARYNSTAVYRKVGMSPFLYTKTYHSTGDITRTVNWKPAEHPWISFRMRLPKAAGKMTLHLVLRTARKKTYTVSLRAPGKAANELNRSRTFEWEPKTWYPITLNIKQMLEGIGVTGEALAGMTISTIGFRRRGAAHADSLFLDDVFIHGLPAEGAKSDAMTWIAYDASGVAGYLVSCRDEAGKELWTETLPPGKVDLTALRARAKGHSWLVCQAKDKAGNLSVPTWIPLPAAP